MFTLPKAEANLVRRTRALIREMQDTAPAHPRDPSNKEKREAWLKYSKYVDDVKNLIHDYYPSLVQEANVKTVCKSVPSTMCYFVRSEESARERQGKKDEAEERETEAFRQELILQSRDKVALELAIEGGNVPRTDTTDDPETQLAIQNIAAAALTERARLQAEQQQGPEAGDETEADVHPPPPPDTDIAPGAAPAPTRVGAPLGEGRDEAAFWIKWDTLPEASRELVQEVIHAFARAHYNQSKGLQAITELFSTGEPQLALDLLKVFAPVPLELPQELQDLLANPGAAPERATTAQQDRDRHDPAVGAAIQTAEGQHPVVDPDVLVMTGPTGEADQLEEQLVMPPPQPQLVPLVPRLIVLDPPKPEAEWIEERLFEMIPDPARLQFERPNEEHNTRTLAAVVYFLLYNELSHTKIARNATAALFQVGDNDVKRALNGRTANYIVVTEEMEPVDPVPPVAPPKQVKRPPLCPIQGVRPFTPPNPFSAAGSAAGRVATPATVSAPPSAETSTGRETRSRSKPDEDEPRSKTKRSRRDKESKGQ